MIINILFVVFLAFVFANDANADPTTAPLLQSSDVTYLGYFTTSSNFNNEVRGLAVSEDGTQLYVGQWESSSGRVNIPAIGGTATQSIAPTSIPGSIGECSVGAELGGIVAYNNRVIISKRCYYNGGGATAGNTHTAGGSNLTGFSTMTRLANITYREQVTGYSGMIPTEWRSLLGGPAFTGNSVMSIITTNSVGPSFFVFNPDDVGVISPIPSAPLMFFPYGTPMYDPYILNDYINAADGTGGMAFPSGFRTVMYVHTKAAGTPCYGSGSACGDSCNPYQGEHGYPYRRQVTLFDANELLAVKNGTKAYHAVRPYGWFVLPGLPASNCGGISNGGVAYDDNSRRMYVATEDYYNNRRIHVFQIAEGSEPPPDTTPPTVSSRVIPSAGTTFVMGFNESVTFTGAVPTLTGCSGGATTLTYASGSSSTSLTFNVSRTVLGAETGCVNSYTQPGNGIEDLAGNDLASFSNQAVTNNSTQVAPDTEDPTTPTNLTATAVSTSQINLSWTASTDNIGIAGYDIRRCAGSGCTPSSIVHSTTGTGTTWNNTGLSASTLYRYDVRARDAVPNYSSYSSIAQATTQAAACRTINVNSLATLYSAFASEQDCDEIIIAPGTYTLNTTALSVDAPNIIVRGSTGNRDDVIIRGDAMTSGSTIKSIFYFQQGNYGQNATIKDMTLGRVGWHIIFFNGAGSGNGTTVDNVRLYDSYEQMLKGTVVGGVGTDNVTVKNSLFEYTAGQSPQWYTGGIDAHSPTGWVIQDNEFRNIKSPSVSVAEHAVHLWSNTGFSGSNTIERNKIVNCDRGIGIWNNTGVHTIRNNMIMHDGSGAYADVGIDIQNSPGQRVYNNTVWIAPSGYYAAMEFRGAATTGSVITNNLTNKQIAQFNGATGTKTTNVENAQSSWFVNVASDLHLASAVASVVKQGTAVTGLVDDFDGDARVNPPDIGADEWMGATDTTPPSVTIATADPSNIITDSLTVTGSASDAVGVDGCKWRRTSAPDADNGTACTGTTSFSCETSGYVEGANTLYVGCYDAAGNYGSDSITVNLDTQAQDITHPTVVSRVIGASGAVFVLTLDEAVTFAGAAPTLFGCSGGATTLAYSSGSSSSALSFAISRQVLGAETDCQTSYVQPGDGIEDLAGNDLFSYSGRTATNESAQTLVALSQIIPARNARLARTITQASLGLTTDKAANCRWGTLPALAWANLTEYATTGDLSHADTLPVEAGGVYRVCARCFDIAAEQYSGDTCASFSVTPKPKGWWWR